MTANLPDRKTWQSLIRPALAIVDSLKTNGYGELDFRFGGGTVLMFRFDHRVSKDIDFFVDDAQALGYISPRLNDVSAAYALEYNEAANTIKIVSDIGDIDFIVAGKVVRDARVEQLRFGERQIKIEATSEILAKKLLYRAALFKPRDVFDMAVALELDRPSAITALRATTSVSDVLLRRLKTLAALVPDALTSDILFTDKGRRFATDMVEKLMDNVHDVVREPQGTGTQESVRSIPRRPATPSG